MQVEKPRAFVFSRQPYPITAARLPKSLSDSGWTVASMCTEDSLLWKTRFVKKRYRCPIFPRHIVIAILKAINEWKPHFIVPGDRWSLYFLQGMARSSLMQILFPRLSELLRRSLGHQEAGSTLDSKVALLDMARGLDEVHVPQDQEVKSVDHAISVIEESFAFPVVVKQDFSSGGLGVSICKDQQEVVSAFARLREDKSDESFLYWLWKMYNQTPFMRSFGKPGKVSIQQFIDGDPYLYSFVALDGKILGGNAVQRELPYDGPNSPHCRYRTVENSQMPKAAAAIVEETGFSGFGCFDFMVDRETNVSYLIECNPFPVNVAHLGYVLGEDLCRTLCQGLSHSVSSSSRYQNKKEDATGFAILFPYELMRDPGSTKILSCPHDVPFDDPNLLTAMQKRFDIPSSSINRLREAYYSGDVQI